MRSKWISEFLAVGRSGSFTAAAQAIGSSVPHVSRAVKALEDELGVKLLSRTTRSVQLTPAGEVLYNECSAISAQLEQALERTQVATKALTGRIRLACLTGSFADNVLAPALAEFAKHNPEIELDVDFDTRRVDLVREGYDAGIRAGEIEDRMLNVRQLIARKRIAAASPAYLTEHGTPQKPQDLKNHICIRALSSFWSFTENGRKRDIDIRGRLRLNSGAAIRAACEQGLGIAYMAERGFGDAIKRGTLTPILEPYWRENAPISMVYPSKEFVPSRISALADFLEEKARMDG